MKFVKFVIPIVLWFALVSAIRIHEVKIGDSS